MNTVLTPIRVPIPPKKQSVQRHWGSHPYFTRRPWNVVQAYVKHFAPNKDHLVLDPFGGSGVTAIEAVVLGRKAIHVDLNPLANFICRQIAVAPVDIQDLRQEFHRIENSCLQYIESLFHFTDEQLEQEPLRAWYPKDIPLPKNSDAKTVKDLFTRRQLIILSTLYEHILKIEDPVQRDLMRFAFSATLNKCNRTYSTTHGRTVGRGNSGIMHTYRYWIPKNQVELNVWREFQQKFRNLVRVKRETNQVIGSNFSRLRIVQGSATRLSEFLQPESVDYIFTDPPYGSHIAYIDLSTMWNAWLGFEVPNGDKQEEVIEGGDLEKSRGDYQALLAQSIGEMKKVIKLNGWMSIVFAHKDLSYWHDLLDAAEGSGFQYENTVVQNSFQFSRHKRANPQSVLSGELILNFRRKQSPRRISMRRDQQEDSQFLLSEVRQILADAETGLSSEEIYNNLIPRLLEHGLLKNGRKSGLLEIGKLLETNCFFDSTESKWFASKAAAQKGRELLALNRSKGQLVLALKTAPDGTK